MISPSKTLNPQSVLRILLPLRRAWSSIMIVLLTFSLLSGCTPSPKKEAPDNKQANSPATPIAPEKPSAEAQAKVNEPVLENANKNAPPIEPEPPVVVEPPKEPPTIQRYVLLGPEGPSIWDLEMRVGDLAIESTNREVQKEIAKQLAITPDFAWKAVFDNRLIRSRQFGNLYPTSDEQKATLIRQNDLNEDGLVQENELWRFVTRGISMRAPIQTSQSDEFFDMQPEDSRIAMLIDRDRDGIFSHQELAEAARSLRTADSDNDEQLRGNELETPSRVGAVKISTSKRSNGDDFLIVLNDEKKEFTTAINTIRRRYSLQNEIQKSDWPANGELFDLLDTDKDGALGKAEWSGLLTVRADVTIQLNLPPVHLDEAKEEKANLTGSVISTIAASSNANALNQGKGVLGGDTIGYQEWVIAPVIADPSSEKEILQQSSIAAQRIGLTEKDPLDLAKFNEMAGDRESEFNFTELDQNGDGKLQWSEHQAAWRARSFTTQGLWRVHWSFHRDRWLAILDTNGDERLTSRELEEAAERLRGCDRNGDGMIGSLEVPQRVWLVATRLLVREGQSMQQALALLDSSRPMMGSSSAGTSGAADGVTGESISGNGEPPAWFRALDQNGDGEISRREFVGEPELFEQLDRNSDRALTLDETQTGPPK